MERDLKYFVEFTKHPETLSDEEFYAKRGELFEFIKANKGKRNFRTQAWEDRKQRLLAEQERRNPIPRAVREEFKEIQAEFEAVCNGENDALYIDVNRRLHKFMRKYQAEYKFTDEQIIEGEEELKGFIQACIEQREIKGKLTAIRIAEQKNLEELDKIIAAQYERTGKIPVFTALKAKKRPDGN